MKIVQVVQEEGVVQEEVVQVVHGEEVVQEEVVQEEVVQVKIVQGVGRVEVVKYYRVFVLHGLGRAVVFVK